MISKISNLNESPLVSVLMPVYNCERYINESVSSILDQTYKNIELIIVDDGSTDRTLQILKELECKNKNIKIFSKHNSGIIDSLNLGLRECSGDIIARFDGDDWSHPERIEKQVQFLNENSDIDIVGTWMQCFGGSNRMVRYPVAHENIIRMMIYANPIGHPTLAARREVFEGNDVQYDQRYLHAEDYGLFVELAETARFSNIPEGLLRYRYGQGLTSKANENRDARIEIYVRIYERVFSRIGATKMSNKMLRAWVLFVRLDIVGAPILKVKELKELIEYVRSALLNYEEYRDICDYLILKYARKNPAILVFYPREIIRALQFKWIRSLGRPLS